MLVILCIVYDNVTDTYLAVAEYDVLMSNYSGDLANDPNVGGDPFKTLFVGRIVSCEICEDEFLPTLYMYMCIIILLSGVHE